MHAYFDCFSGISGDMVLGAFVDMGISTAWLKETISHLGIGDVEITVKDIKTNGIGAKSVSVIEKGEATHRQYPDIVSIIQAAALPETVKSTALKIFDRIAEAEAIIHRCNKDHVHFHEVGAVDSIVDIVGVALCLDYLKIESVTASPLPLGSGFVYCAHGRLPVPAPATVEILKGIPVYGGTVEGELITPTGAGIVACLAQEFGPIPPMTINRIGYGAGSREYPNHPNLLRIFVGEKDTQLIDEAQHEDVYMVATNIDDMTPEIFGYLMDKLFLDGALDVCFVPVTMKKNRPGIKIEVLCHAKDKAAVTRCLFSETSTLGVRYHLVHRHILKRSISHVQTQFGEITVKWTVDPNGRKRYAPEYENCKKIALMQNIPLRAVYDAVANAVQGADIECGSLDG